MDNERNIERPPCEFVYFGIQPVWLGVVGEFYYVPIKAAELTSKMWVVKRGDEIHVGWGSTANRPDVVRDPDRFGKEFGPLWIINFVESLGGKYVDICDSGIDITGLPAMKRKG